MALNQVVLLSLLCLHSLSFRLDRLSKKKTDPSYDQNIANHTLMFAYGAYCDEDQLESWSCKWCQYVPGFEISTVANTKGLQAFVGYDTEYKQTVVSFRGTHNVEDWLDDLDFIKVKYPGVDGGEVHKGFYDAWQTLLPLIMPATEKLLDSYKNGQVLVTGHSLGAALAQLCALNVSYYMANTNNNGFIFVEDFGSPRWGNDVMADYFTEQIGFHYRLTNLHDMVPTVPPEAFGFHHTSTEVHYTSDEPLQYQICDGSGEDKNCSYFGDSIEDHLHYLDLYESCS